MQGVASLFYSLLLMIYHHYLAKKIRRHPFQISKLGNLLFLLRKSKFSKQGIFGRKVEEVESRYGFRGVCLI